MDVAVENAVADAIAQSSTTVFDASLPDVIPELPSKPAAPQNIEAPPVQARPPPVTIDSCDEDEDQSADEEETEEDRAFINDSAVDKAENDVAAIDESNIITGRRRRQAPTRWEHPDTGLVMRQYMKRKGITSEDLEELEEEESEEGENSDLTETTEDETFESDVEEVDEGDSEFDSDFTDDDEELACSTDEELEALPVAPPALSQPIAAEVLDGPEEVVVAPPVKKRRTN